ncbi:amidohydrolase family protein [Bacteroidota bacterium]
MNKKILILILLLSSFLPSLNAQKYIIHCGYILDIHSGKYLKNKTILVEGNKITGIENGYIGDYQEGKVIDLKDKYILPGFADMHVHLESEMTRGSYINQFTLNEADVAYNAAVNARKTLMAGFTTVRDVGGSGVNTSLRNAINAGKVPGPRIISCGKGIGTTGGHADPTNGYKKDLMGDPGPDDGVINSPADARKAVRQRYKNGADAIKITATGGVLSLSKSGMAPQYTMEELEAIVATATDYNMITAAHAHGTEGMKRALLAGIQTIEHGTFMTREIMDLMVERGAYMVPTLTAGATIMENAELADYYPEIVVPKIREIGPHGMNTFSKALEKGVKMLFGTDAGVFPHGNNAREFELMVKNGMIPLHAIQCATIEPAKLFGNEENLGSIEVNKLADIIAVDSDPLKNISILKNVGFVIKDGVIYKNDME